jgi:hypothetical protein
MNKIDKIKNLARTIELLTVNATYYKIARNSDDVETKQAAQKYWNSLLQAVHYGLVDIVEPNDEQAEAMKLELKDVTSCVS